MSIGRDILQLTGSKLSCQMKHRFGFAWLLVVIGVFNASVWATLRWSYESSMRSVQLTVALDEVRRLADSSQVAPLEVLSEMKARGVSSVVLALQNLDTWHEVGRVDIVSASKARQLFGFRRFLPNYSYVLRVTRENRAVLKQIATHLAAQSGRNQQPVWLDAQTLAIAQAHDSWNQMPLGFDPDQVALVRAAGLRVTARVFNPLGLTPQVLRTMLDDAKATGARVVIVGDDETLGYSTLIEPTARELQKRHLLFGASEFSQQAGEQDLTALSNGSLVRIHNLSEAEASHITPRKLIDRYVRAVRERGVRLVLFRVLESAKGEAFSSRNSAGTLSNASSRNILQHNLQIISSISQTLKHGGLQPSFALRDASAFGNYPAQNLESHLRSSALVRSLSQAALFLSGLGVLGGVLLLLELCCDWSRKARMRAAMFGMIVVAALSFSALRGAQVLAAVAACVFPIVGILWGGLPQTLTRDASCPVRFLTACGVLLRTTAITLCGALLVVALLGRWQFLSKTDDFLGTKIVQIVPLVLLAYALSGQFFPHRVRVEGASIAHRRAWQQWRLWLQQPYTIRVALWSALGAVGLFLWMTRSGNDSGLDVPEWEWRMRSVLEHLLLARPRTKEILVGHPALILAVWLAPKRKVNALFFAILLAVVGQADVMNTFCQVNNPLWFCVLRTIIALCLGMAVGFIAWCALRVLAPSSTRNAFEQRTPNALQNKLVRQWLLSVWLLPAFVAVIILVVCLTKKRTTTELVPVSLRDVAAPEATWPWPGAHQRTLHRGITQWTARAADGTSLDLIEFDFARNPQLRFEIYDQDEDDDVPFDNRVAYWNRGVGVVTRDLNQRFARQGNGRVVVAWNGLFFGLKNWKPRQADRAFHLAPLVLHGRILDYAPEPRWMFGVQTEKGKPQFRVIFRPTPAQKARFDFAAGSAQCLLLNGRALALAPYPTTPIDEKRLPATPQNAGHIPVLDEIRTSRVSMAWTRNSQRFYLLFVKEPDGENGSRAAFARSLPATDRLSRGGWMLSDVQHFWMSMRHSKNVWSAINSDGGDVAQLLYTQPNDNYQFLAPRFVLDTLPGGKKRDATTRRTLAPDLKNALPGGTIMSFYVRDSAAFNANRVLEVPRTPFVTSTKFKKPSSQ